MGLKHLAIIMDGNGRWAQRRGFGRILGHRRGAKRVDEIVTACCEQGVTHLTLYAFSTENWNRPGAEVQMLMRLLVQHLRTMDKKLVRNRVSLTAQGSLERLPPFVRTELSRVMRMTALREPRLKLNLALSYGGREEIAQAARRLATQVAQGTLAPEAITEDSISENLYHPEFPDPDLLIRTGGEHRVSNFLLWQIAYAEFYVAETLWPDFGPEELARALAAFEGRERRFGKTSEQIQSVPSEVRA